MSWSSKTVKNAAIPCSSTLGMVARAERKRTWLLELVLMALVFFLRDERGFQRGG